MHGALSEDQVQNQITPKRQWDELHVKWIVGCRTVAHAPARHAHVVAQQLEGARAHAGEQAHSPRHLADFTAERRRAGQVIEYMAGICELGSGELGDVEGSR